MYMHFVMDTWGAMKMQSYNVKISSLGFILTITLTFVCLVIGYQ